jgi:hypothetical protein
MFMQHGRFKLNPVHSLSWWFFNNQLLPHYYFPGAGKAVVFNKSD